MKHIRFPVSCGWAVAAAAFLWGMPPAVAVGVQLEDPPMESHGERIGSPRFEKAEPGPPTGSPKFDEAEPGPSSGSPKFDEAEPGPPDDLSNVAASGRPTEVQSSGPQPSAAAEDWATQGDDVVGAGVQPQAVALDGDLEFLDVVVGPGGVVLQGDSGGVAGDDARLIYSNTLGIHSVNFPTNQPVSDDIATTAPDGCNLRSFTFKVLGKVTLPGTCSSGSHYLQPCTMPADCPGGTCTAAAGTPYTVKYALYSNCPWALGSPNATLRELIKIPGTSGEISFPDDAPRAIKHVVDSHNPVAIPTNVYLGLQFSRANCGAVVGAPAMVGFSADLWDYPGFPCNAFLGGFPQNPHASFWLEIYGDATCPAAFAGYKAARPSGGPATIGANVQGVDDIKLQVDDCEMVGYEVVVRGAGFYTFDLRRQCDGQIIPGTERTFMVLPTTTPQLQVARFTFDPPVPLIDDDFFFGFRSTSNSSGAVIAGVEPVIGESTLDYFIVGLDGCFPVNPVSGVHGAVNLAITCAGELPVGACCDMELTQCVDGPDDGKRCISECVGGARYSELCLSDSDCPGGACSVPCKPPGECAALCRETTKMNCPWPPPTCPSPYSYCTPPPWEPAWVENGTCAAPPFEHACGLSACCKPDDTCANLTRHECSKIPPPNGARVWQAGKLCGEENQSCPFSACVARQGECSVVHDGVGCSNSWCCQDVCTSDAWCCQVEWDRDCVREADVLCEGSAYHTRCPSALVVAPNSTTFLGNSQSTESGIEPGFCCNIAQPDAKGFGPVWLKFVASHDSVQVETCESDAAGDSMVNLFAVGDGSSDVTACGSLSLIGCSDDGCSSSGRHSNLCVQGLVPGNTYYILLASKTLETKGTHQVRLRSPADCARYWPGEDCNDNGRTDGCDLVAGTSADCDQDDVPDECENLVHHSNETSQCAQFQQHIESDTQSNGYGAAVSSDGQWLFVGDPAETIDGIDFSGAVYVYLWSGNAWTQTQKLVMECVSQGCEFGQSVSVSGSEAMILSRTYPGVHHGTLHVYKLVGGLWLKSGEFAEPPVDGLYWSKVDLEGNTVAIAGVADSWYWCDDRAVVFIYHRTSSGWELAARAPSVGSFNACGFAMEFRDGILGVVSPLELGDQDYQDSVYLFEQRGTSWQQSGRIALPVSTLAPSVSVRASTAIVVGSEWVSDRWVSTGYIIQGEETGWYIESTVTHPLISNYYLGQAVALCRGGLAAMLVTGPTSLCPHILFFQRYPTGVWREVCDVPLQGCLLSAGTPLMSCDNLMGIAATSSAYSYETLPGSVFGFHPPPVDCNENKLADECELADYSEEDCNFNGTLDQCDLRRFGDFDFSRSVTIRDFASLQGCFSEESNSPATCCSIFDMNPPDGDIKLMDLAAFVGAMTGP